MNKNHSIRLLQNGEGVFFLHKPTITTKKIIIYSFYILFFTQFTNLYADMVKLITDELDVTLPTDFVPSLKLVLTTDDTTAKMSIDLLTGGELFAGVDYAITFDTATAVSTPSGAIDITDQEALNAWFGEDPIAFFEAIGFPDELMTILRQNMVTPDYEFDVVAPGYAA